MHATLSENEALRQDFVAELAEEAFQVASRHGVRGPSVARELELWKALEARTPGADGPAAGRRTDLVAVLTDTAYRTTLERGIRGSFLDLQLELWRAVCQTLRKGRFGTRFWNSLRQSADEPLNCGCASNR